MEYSHLSDTDFPILRTANPYALRNTFDYTRWVANTTVHLVNVLWGGDYSNVVKFDDDAKRDAWFDGIQDSFVITLKSNAHIVPDGTIKLPLPYDVAARYNYLFVDIPLATSQEDPIEYENESGVRRWYFFVGNISYSAPNTTTFSVQADVWTNFINESRISYMMLRRGHAPVSATDTDAYLANPIGNNRYLLAPDVNYDDSSIVRKSDFIPIGAGTKWICFASTVSRTRIDTDLGSVNASTATSYSRPTFSNTSDWYGYQLQVNGFEFASAGDYSNMHTIATPYLYPDFRTPNGVDVFAVPASDTSFLNDVEARCPVFLRTVQATFMVDESMIVLFEEHHLAGHTIWYLHSAESELMNYTLTKGDFGFDANEQRFAKLYTYPYSSLEVSDNQGHSVDVRIENTGDVRVNMIASVLYPILDCRVYLTGINGIGSKSYMWKSMGDEEIERELPDGDWGRLCFDFDIPTYSLYLDPETAWYLDNYNTTNVNGREGLLAAYHNKVRSANSDYTNANASAATAKTNANDSAATAQTNANASADTTHKNTDNVAQCYSDNIDLAIATNTANLTEANTAAFKITNKKNQQASLVTSQTNTISVITTSKENETSLATTKNSAGGNFLTSIANGAASGAESGGPGGAVIGALLGGATASIEAGVAIENATAVTQANAEVTALNTSANDTITTEERVTATAVTTVTTEKNTHVNKNNNDCLDKQRTNNYDTNTTNSKNLYDTSTDNSGRTYNTAVGNAARTYATSTANSSRSRQVQVLNAQESLFASQDQYQATRLDRRRGAPQALTSASGDARQWAFMQNGLQIRLRTQSDSAIAQTAAYFARYGYALNQVWDVGASGLNLMKHFTFWQAQDVWVDVRDVASAEVADVLADVFTNGVTIWADPDEIGKVPIYDN